MSSLVQKWFRPTKIDFGIVAFYFLLLLTQGHCMTFTLHWNDLQLSVKQLGWVSAPLSVRLWFILCSSGGGGWDGFVKHQQRCGCCTGLLWWREKFFILCSNPHPWSWYQGNDRKIKVGNTSGRFLCRVSLFSFKDVVEVIRISG